jgi:trans-aconitate methyltransferase
MEDQMPLDFDGARYTEASTHQQQWGERLIEALTLKGDERVLDLGCGDGLLTSHLALRVPRGHVVGIDASPGMLAVARERQGPNLEFELLDINALPYESAFDLVFSNATLHFVLDHTLLLGNVHRALRNGGLARCNFAADGNCVHFFQAVRDTMAAPAYRTFFEDFTWPYFMPRVEEYRGLVGEFPFAEHDVWGEPADRSFPDEDALTRWIDQPAIVAFLQPLDEPLRPRFRNTVVAKTIALTRQEDGRCFETFRRVNLLVKK